MWRPCPALSEKQLWLWIHPAAFVESASAITAACEHMNSENPHNPVHLFDRRGELARFQIRGRGTASILLSLCSKSTSGTFVTADWEEILMHGRRKNLEVFRRELHDQKRNNKTHPFDQNQTTYDSIFPVIIQDPRWKDSNDVKTEQMLSLMSEPTPREIPSNIVYSPLTGADITASLNNSDDIEPDVEKLMQEITDLSEWKGYRQAPSRSQMEDALTVDSTQHLSVSPLSLLWSPRGRTFVNSNFTHDHTMNQIRYIRRRKPMDSKAHVDGFEMHLMFIRQSNSAFPDLSGWDILVVPSYSVTLLEALSSRGAMIIGLEENHAISTVGNAMRYVSIPSPTF